MVTFSINFKVKYLGSKKQSHSTIYQSEKINSRIKLKIKLVVGPQSFNPSTREVEVGKSVSSRPARVLGS